MNYKEFYKEGYYQKGKSQFIGIPKRSPVFRHYAVSRLPIIKPGSRLLDIGCGVGALVAEFRDLGVDAWGLDVSEEAQEKVLPEISPYFVLGDAQDLPFPDNSFDWVHSDSTLEHFQAPIDLQLVLKECSRVAPRGLHGISASMNGDFGDCTQNGLDLTGIDQGHLTMFSLSWWENTFRAAGIEDVGLASIEACHWGWRRFGGLIAVWPTTEEVREWIFNRIADDALFNWTVFGGAVKDLDHPNHAWGPRGVEMQYNAPLPSLEAVGSEFQRALAKVNRDGPRAMPDIPSVVIPAVFLQCLGFTVTNITATEFQGKIKLTVETNRGTYEWVM